MTRTPKTKAADKNKVAADIFKALGRVTADPKTARPHLERVCLQRPSGAVGAVRLEAIDGSRAVYVDVREDMLPDGLVLGRYDPRRAAAMLALGQAPSPEDDDGRAWPNIGQRIPQCSDKAQAPQHYDPTLLGETLAVVGALAAVLQGHKKPRATRVQLGEEKAPCRIDVSGDGWSLVAVVMPMRE